MATKPGSFSPTHSGVVMCTPKQVLVTRDPVYIRQDIQNGHYVGKKPQNYILLALFITIINPLLGPISIMFSIMSDRSYGAADLKYANKWAGYSFTASMMTFIFSAILYIAIGFALSDIGVKGGHAY